MSIPHVCRKGHTECCPWGAFRDHKGCILTKTMYMHFSDLLKVKWPRKFVALQTNLVVGARTFLVLWRPSQVILGNIIMSKMAFVKVMWRLAINKWTISTLSLCDYMRGYNSVHEMVQKISAPFVNNTIRGFCQWGSQKRKRRSGSPAVLGSQGQASCTVLVGLQPHLECDMTRSHALPVPIYRSWWLWASQTWGNFSKNWSTDQDWATAASRGLYSSRLLGYWLMSFKIYLSTGMLQ